MLEGYPCSWREIFDMGVVETIQLGMGKGGSAQCGGEKEQYRAWGQAPV